MPTTITHNGANRRFAREHNEWHKRFQCHSPDLVIAWPDCDMFTQMRIRGIGYTLYLVPVPAWRDLEITGAAGCLLVKWQDDGGAQVDEPRCLADAMLLAATMVATEPEYLEQLPGAARESLVQLARVLSGE